MGFPPRDGDIDKAGWSQAPDYQMQHPQQWPDQSQMKPVPSATKDLKDLVFSALKRIGALASVMLFVYLGLAVAVLLILSPEIFTGLDGNTGVLYVVTPFIVPIALIDGLALGAFFAFLVGAIVLSFGYSFLASAKKILKELAVGKMERHSPILAVGGLFFGMFMFNFLFYTAIEAGGVTPTVPDFYDEPFWETVYGFAKASVWEEVVSRVLLIGVPLLWLDLLLRRDELKQIRHYYLGGGFDLGLAECCLIAFSALMFGLGHVQGWDLWKAVPATVVGLAFGYLFLRYGLYAAIMLHFAFDFLDIPAIYLNAESSSLFAMLILFWWAVGAIFLVYYTMQLGGFLLKKIAGEERIGAGP